MQSLVVLQSFSAMLGHGQDSLQPPVIEDFVTRCAHAGFDGLGLVCGTPFRHRLTVDLLEERDLVWEAQCYPQTVEDLKPVVETAANLGAHHINLQPDARLSTLGACVKMLQGWQKLADDAGVDLMIETHRNRMTNDLLFTLDLLDALPAMKMTGDLSHYVVAREMWMPLQDDNAARMDRLVERCWAFHGRVGSSEQIQLPLHFPRTAPWLDQYCQWWHHGFGAWRKRAHANASFSFLCELIGAPYALTDEQGREFSDRWQESLAMMAMVRSIWNEGMAVPRNIGRQ